MTHCIAASVVPRSASIVGSATLTTDSSTNAMVDPNTAAASTQAWSRLAQAEVPRVDRMTSAAQGCAFEEITCCRSIRACPGGAIVHRPAAPLPRDFFSTPLRLKIAPAVRTRETRRGSNVHDDPWRDRVAVLVRMLGHVRAARGGQRRGGTLRCSHQRRNRLRRLRRRPLRRGCGHQGRSPRLCRTARARVDAHGKAVAPGFVNMLAHPEESLLVDGRALSDLRQGVTLEVLGEDSMGPLNPEMKRLATQRQADIRYTIDWTTLGEYLHRLEQRGIAPNVASYVGAGTVRNNVLGERDVQPTPAQLAQMRALVRQAMEEGALGVTTALIYSPNDYAKTPELMALASESARCGGLYSVHMRSEGDRLIEAVQETIDIAKASGAPAEIYHLKAAGKRNWNKLDALIHEVETARAAGIRITADMYVYTAGATGFEAAMPPWAQDGGLEAWIARLKDPAVRTRVLAEMRDPAPAWENLYGAAGAAGTLLLGFKNPALKPLTGKTLAEVARQRGVSPEDAAIDLVVQDGSRVAVAYFLMSEENVRREVALPWVSFDSDADAPAPEGVFLKSSRHPRTYGNFARV